MSESETGLPPSCAIIKRSFDLGLSLIGLLFLWWLILLAALIAYFDTGLNGFIVQARIGRFGKPFRIVKIRTMKSVAGLNSTVTADGDPRITKIGRFFRKAKIDELPQLVNIFLGQMSFVGPRPDVPGFADALSGQDLIILSVRPGITGPATLKYKHEESLLAQQDDPEKYNREVIFPDKVRLNRDYIKNYTFWTDIIYIWKTVFN